MPSATPSDRPRSEFAIALARLLDETGYFSRSEWARFLDVSESALSQWVNDRTIPRADLLRMILDALRAAKGVPAGPLEAFEQLMRKPAEEISPLGTRMLPTVAEYLRKTTLREFGRELRKLPTDQQIKVLTSGGWETNPSQEEGTASSPTWARVTAARCRWFVDERIRSVRTSGTSFLPSLQRMKPGEPQAERVDWQALLSTRAALIVGQPGTGKSHMLAMLAEVFLRREEMPTVQLHPCAGFGMGKSSLLREFYETWDRAGKRLAVLIDGFDEFPVEDRAPAALEVVEMLQRAPEVRMFVTSRPIPELSLLEGFEPFSILPLTSVQVLLWLQNQRAQASSEESPVAAAAEFERFLCHLTERRALQSSFRTPLFLECAWTLFVRNAVTPFSEAEVVGEFLRRLFDEWERGKNVVRAREPWASPRNLLEMLGEVCFQLVLSQMDEFTTTHVEQWIQGRFRHVPSQRLLPLLSTQSGIVEEAGPGRWRVVHDYLRRYLAAAHAVESSASAAEHLKRWWGRDELREVFRLACGITSDATPMLEAVLEAKDAPKGERGLLLAEILAQPLAASPSIVALSCDAMVSWLDNELHGWQVEAGPQAGSEPETLWELKATGIVQREYDSRVSKTLAAVHRARSGPAREPLMQRLGNAQSPLLPAFALSLNVEGRLQLDLEPGTGRKTLKASVVVPQLV
jgi:transcriptional regulator with XRE-family HTH domain